MQALAALAAEPVAALVDTMWIGRAGPLQLAAVAAAAAIFNLATKVINMPLAAVTTSLVAAATTATAGGNSGRCTWRGGGGRCGWQGSGSGPGAAAAPQAAVSGALCAGLAAGLLQGESAPSFMITWKPLSDNQNNFQLPPKNMSFSGVLARLPNSARQLVRYRGSHW